MSSKCTAPYSLYHEDGLIQFEKKASVLVLPHVASIAPNKQRSLFDVLIEKKRISDVLLLSIVPLNASLACVWLLAGVLYVFALFWGPFEIYRAPI